MDTRRWSVAAAKLDTKIGSCCCAKLGKRKTSKRVLVKYDLVRIKDGCLVLLSSGWGDGRDGFG